MTQDPDRSGARARATGFICPDCQPTIVEFDSEELLIRHWAAFHDDHSAAADLITGNITTNAAPTTVVERAHVFVEGQGFGKPCRICTDRVWRRAAMCTNCRYICHERCIGQARKHLDCPGFYQKTSTLVRQIRKVVTGNKVRYVTEVVDLDLTYITPRIIAMSLPATGLQAAYRNNLKDVAAFLNSKHGSNYMIFNVSDKKYDIEEFHNQVLDFGWPDHMAPSLERLASICNSIDSWIEADPNNVIAVHCKGGKGRTALSTNSPSFGADIISFTSDKKSSGITNPSQRRYVLYFEAVLAGQLKVYRKHLVLEHVYLQGIPAFDGSGGCRPYLSIMEDFRVVYQSPEPIRTFRRDDKFIQFDLDQGLHLAGDVVIECYHRPSRGADVLMFRIQFPTCVVADRVSDCMFIVVPPPRRTWVPMRLIPMSAWVQVYTFEKHQLDEAYKDARFPEETNISCMFRSMSEEEKRVAEADIHKSLPAIDALLQRRERESESRKNDFAASLLNPDEDDDGSSDLGHTRQSKLTALQRSATVSAGHPTRRALHRSVSVGSPQLEGEEVHELVDQGVTSEVAALPRTKTSAAARQGSSSQAKALPVFDPSNPFAELVEAERSAMQAKDAATAEGVGDAAVTELGGDSLMVERPLLRRSSSLLELGSHRLVDEKQRIERSELRQRTAADVTMPRRHESCAWYFADFTKEATDRLLLEKGQPGEFVVRRDPLDSHTFYLSVRCPESVVVHLLVQWVPRQQQFELDHRACFADMQQLIKFYSSNTVARVGEHAVKLTHGFATQGLPDASRRTSVSALSRLQLVARDSRQARTASMYSAEGNTPTDKDVWAMRNLMLD
ncbi:uncharacterized protein MONBRDRAFT_12682 [Monosiga brevicollis MX1]|uniref:Phosphatidylinositol-3,4,5-trisphosphate 3-phosphatase n=1 Tax=Monosiga brevicollis TaxID=81824 RepID=A9VD03_MONBE|nr:uncharacterized protein MONBRDRAFT_12682 [Monosiga brevicollis MX1]EDQ84558.1 predicted protein [Monosiga brevicollis MX1]|eukprot:XP_001750585.1 hypothetical protein [Monosiga brevicollis MX1]